MVAELQLRELLLHDLGHGLAPQTAGGHDVGLVERPDGRSRVLGQGEVCSETSDTLDLVAGVRLSVERVAAAIVLFTVAEVDTTSKLTDNVKVDATADLRLERRAVDERVRGEETGTKVAVCAHLLAELQDALLWTYSTGAPLGTTDGTKKNGISGLCC